MTSPHPTPFLNLCFQLGSIIALLAWLAVFFLPGWVLAHLEWMVIPVGLLCVLYVYTLLLGGRFDAPGTAPRGHFRSMAGVLRLFQSPRAVLVGWIHFLAFDLMVGLFILYDAAGHGIGHLWILPCLFLTLMFGPAGLLSYILLRFVLT